MGKDPAAPSSSNASQHTAALTQSRSRSALIVQNPDPLKVAKYQSLSATDRFDVMLDTLKTTIASAFISKSNSFDTLVLRDLFTLLQEAKHGNYSNPLWPPNAIGRPPASYTLQEAQSALMVAARLLDMMKQSRQPTAKRPKPRPSKATCSNVARDVDKQLSTHGTNLIDAINNKYRIDPSGDPHAPNRTSAAASASTASALHPGGVRIYQWFSTHTVSDAFKRDWQRVEDSLPTMPLPKMYEHYLRLAALRLVQNHSQDEMNSI